MNNVGVDLRFMSIREVSKAYGISERYLRDLDHRNQLPGFKTGNRMNVHVPLLLAQLEQESQRDGQEEHR